MAQNEQDKDLLIIELQQQLANLEATEQRYVSLFEDAGDAIYIADPITFDIIDGNSAAARRLGYTQEELFALNLDDLEVLPDEDDINMLSAWQSSGRGTNSYECHYRCKDGSLIQVEVSSRIVNIGYRQILQNSVRDITKRKEAETALRDSNERLSILQQIDTELALRLDVKYVVMLALDAALRLSYADTGVIGLVEGDKIRLVHAIGRYSLEVGEFLPRDRGIAARVVHRQQSELILDVRTDPDYVPLNPDTRAQMTLPLISGQRLIGILSLETVHPERFSADTFDFMQLLVSRVAVAIDNANAYEEQAKLIEDLNAFAHTVAHDLKNPLGVVLGYAHMLADDITTAPDEEVQKFLMMIINGGDKMLNIINELLLLASVRRLDEVETSPLDMDDVVRGALSRLTLMIEEKQAKIVIPDTWPVASGYAGWVEEVWANYISNAIKYGGTPPLIELGAALQDDGMVRFWVHDNGFGLDPEQQAQLFSQFTRLDETRAQGHGLGLSIVQRIVDKLGGQVGVESKIGVGSVFNFTLPESS